MGEEELIFEDSLGDDWARDLEVAEVPLSDRPLAHLAWIALVLGAVLALRIAFLAGPAGAFYGTRADHNLNQYIETPGPRGMITDRFGTPLATSTPVISVLLDLQEFLNHPELQAGTLDRIQHSLGISEEDVLSRIEESDLEQSSEPIILAHDISESAAAALKSAALPTLHLQETYRRTYMHGPVFSSLVGYVGLASKEDVTAHPELAAREFVGKTGIEAEYEERLQGKRGVTVTRRNARGRVLDTVIKNIPEPGGTVSLTIDAELQTYFYNRLAVGLQSLGRTSGAGLAIDPESGEILALISFPSFDNNAFSAADRIDERVKLLTDPLKPLFNRAVSGMYTPGSTIKPLVGVAALAEGVVDPSRTVFSPGYLDVPNPFDPSKSTHYLDWRYQGTIDLSSAIAQSSDVYFYEVGGGSPPGAVPGQDGISGLGITRLRAWWQKFNLGLITGIDLPGESKGFLPSPDWKEKRTNRPWLLGDTYNVSIGQGDLLLTPVQLLSYIAAVANGGTLYRPYLAKSATTTLVTRDLTALAPEIKEVQKGMREAVTSPLGTAYKLDDLPFAVGAKTGSSQIENNTQENAFFVGYAPFDTPQIAILVLVERSKEGSLNAVPIAKDVLAWYYGHRIKK